MNNIDVILMALKNLFRRKSRTFLTTLGIVIGTISILLTVSLGFGIKKNIENQLKSFGSLNIIEVRPSYEKSRSTSRNRNEENKIKEEDIEKIKAIDGVGKVSPIMQESATLICGKYIAQYVQIKGIDPEFMKEMSPTITEGRMLKSGDTDSIVIGESVLYNFRDKNSLGVGGYREMMGANGEIAKPKVDPMKDKIALTFDTNYGIKGSSMSNSQKN